MIYPLLIGGFVLWFYIEAVNSFHYKSDSISMVGLLNDFYWISNFWFLKSCFLCYCLAYVSCHLGLKREYGLAISMLISQIIPPLYFPFMYPCFVIGICLKTNEIWMERIVSLRYFLLLVFTVMLFANTSDVYIQGHTMPSGILHADAMVWIKIFVFRLFRQLIGIIGSLTFISISYSLFTNNSNPSFNFLAKLGRYTLEIYILQYVLESRIGIKSITYFDSMNIILFDYVFTPIVSIAVIVICFLFIRLVYSRRIIGLLLFGKDNGFH